MPLSKILVFTEHDSHIRRLGVASTIKNVAFDIDSHPKLLAPRYSSANSQPLLTISSSPNDDDTHPDPLDLLPYILLPLCGPSAASFSTEDMEDMLEDLQLLPANKKREPDNEILKTHLETLLLLTTTREGRDTLRRVKVYPVIRELHVDVEDDGIREGADRLVQVLMRDEVEEAEMDENMKPGGLLGEDAKHCERNERVQEVDSDDDVVEVL